MKYYICKPKTHKIDNNIIEGIIQINSLTNNGTLIVDNIVNADIIVMQNGWTKSKFCMAEYFLAKKLNKRIVEGYTFIDKYTVHIN